MNILFYIILILFINCNTVLKLNSQSVNPNPVVFKTTLNFVPSELVAFKFEGGWVQIPVQVDEMDSFDIAKPYNGYQPLTGYKTLLYTDSNTWTGADSNVNIDYNDEIVVMHKDAGGIANSSYPNGVIAGSKKQVTISDPLGVTTYVYLFKSDGSIQSGAGVSYVNYTFSPNYKTNFNVANGVLNAENSLVTTSFYSLRFTAEWIMPDLTIGGVEILDAHKQFFADGDCVRSELSFSTGENAFIVNKLGPVRAIRIIEGANSGPHTTRAYFFYEGRTDVITDLRVHSIASIYDAYDYNTNAIGMKYSNNLNLTQSTIDGVQDTRVKTGSVLWECVSGNMGSLVILHRRSHSFSTKHIKFVGYYDDNQLTPASNCTGDDKAIGTSGIGATFSNTNLFTEVNRMGLLWTSSNFRTYRQLRSVYYEAPNATNTTATTINNKYSYPLSVTIN